MKRVDGDLPEITSHDGAYKKDWERWVSLKQSVTLILEHTRNHGWTAGYQLNLELTHKFEQMNSEKDLPILSSALADYLRGEDSIADKDLAFSVFYVTCIGYYRKRDKKEVLALVNAFVGTSEKQFSIEDYPAIWDILCRLFLINDCFAMEWVCACAGIESMNNMSLTVSYTGAVTYRLTDDHENKLRDIYNVALNDYVFGKLVEADKNVPLKDCIMQAIKYAVGSILHERSYAKYYFNLAKLMFYASSYYRRHQDEIPESPEKQLAWALEGYDDAQITWEDFVAPDGHVLVKTLNHLIDEGIQRANSDGFETNAKRVEYETFREIVESEFDEGSSIVKKKKSKIIDSRQISEAKKYVRRTEGMPSVLVSYSHKNYRTVLCDILELQHHGVKVAFDDDFESTDRRGNPGWLKMFESMAEKVDCVICYISKEYCCSKACTSELSLINRLGKTVVPVNISDDEILANLIQDLLAAKKIDNKMFEVLSKNFNQNIVPISKSIPMSARHIPSLLRSISHFNFKVQTVHAINDKGGQVGHPYEDFLYTDSENGVYVVADGITRKEGFNGEKTTASMISSTFSEVMVQTLAESLNGQSNDIAEVIRDSLTESRNLTFEKLNGDPEYQSIMDWEKRAAKEKGIWYEPPGCVASILVIHNRTAYCATVGDCSCVLLRADKKIILSEPQTYYAFKVDRVEADRKLLYEEYVNKPRNEGYAVINDDAPIPNELMTVKRIEIRQKDRIYLFTDGFVDLVIGCPIKIYKDKDAVGLLQVNDDLFSDVKKDDRTLIMIDVL